MASLYKGKYCGACHNGKNAFASDTQCARCHVGARYPVPQKDEPDYKKKVTLGKSEQKIVFHHDQHLKKAKCATCHPSLFVPKEGAAVIKMADHASRKYCFGCHDEKGTLTFSRNDCNRCHTKTMPVPQEAILYGKGAKAVSFKHDKHQLKAGCGACHPKLFAYRKGNTKIDFNDHVNRAACFVCHAKKDGTAFYNCNLCHKDKPAIKTSYYPDTLSYKTKMQNVYFHHESHAGFACTVCHPNPFAMKKGKTDMNMAEMMKGKTCGMCHNGARGFSVNDCARCHKK
jgi:c(7)-type cytochrome triheme protein